MFNFLDDIILMNWYVKLYINGKPISSSLTGCNNEMKSIEDLNKPTIHGVASMATS